MTFIRIPLFYKYTCLLNLHKMISLLFLFSSSIGLITVFLLLIRIKNNSFSNIYLLIAFLIIALRFLFIGIKEVYFFRYFSSFDLISNMPVLSIFVLLYLYFKNLITNEKNIDIKKLFHLPPFLILYAIVILNFNKQIALPINYILGIIIVYIIIYLIKSYILLKNKIWNRKSNLSIVNQHQNLIKNWTKFLFVFLNLVLIKTIVQFYFYELKLSSLNEDFFEASLCIIVLFIFLKVLMTPEILYGYDFLINKIENKKTKEIVMLRIWKIKLIPKLENIQENNLRDVVFKNLNKYILLLNQVEFLDSTFKNTNFKLIDLANLLSIPKSHLLFLFKHHCNLSFSDYKKAVRIKEAIRIINDGYLNSNTIESLAKEVGFSSYSPFFTSFKNITGVSPQEYSSGIVEANQNSQFKSNKPVINLQK